MTAYKLKFTLLSDTAFGSGEGVAGLIDSDVQSDEWGLPYLAGRTLRGMLNAECADILFALDQQNKKAVWKEPAHQLFGEPGSGVDNTSALHFGDARLPQALRREVEVAIDNDELTKAEMLEALTAIRRQTAIDEETNVALDNSLRSMRVILRQTPFEADLHFVEEPSTGTLALLAACVKAWRRAGLSRNRGLGELQATLHNAQGDDITENCFAEFKRRVQE